MNTRSSREIVVGVDGSPACRGAAVWAAALASRTAAPLWVVHALPKSLDSMTAVAVMGQGPAMAQHRTAGEMILEETSAAVRLRFPDLDVRTDLIPGPTVRTLAASSATARMIVVGGAEPRGWGMLATGSTAIELVRHSTCPVTVWRGQSGMLPDRRPVVVGVDGSVSSAAAVIDAFEFARLFNAPVTAVYGWATRHSAGDVTVPLLVDWDALRESESGLLTGWLAEAKQRYPGVAVAEVVEPRNPAHLITGRATDAQLVVVGSHGRGRLAAAVLGSVSQYLLHHSRCPTMIHRGPPQESG
ncbi:universal stress protein (plasmid) [Rhodococcus pseudokoreensis]|uniref:Universal stress protein n=1 Tax=Rhodococcus pseudokoreensis TaxID=2811421 RepID=A0A974VWV0_9NOCA|nr:universal stress protein [Rhodococcus pseudokoreensis]QSE87300.1 universal stress protein [Rhodococcus pseudokoreensis]